MNDKAGLAANQDYGKDELSAEKLLTRHTALQTAVDTYSPIIRGLAEQARKLVQSGHFAASKVASRQVYNFLDESRAFRELGNNNSSREMRLFVYPYKLK